MGRQLEKRSDIRGGLNNREWVSFADKRDDGEE